MMKNIKSYNLFESNLDRMPTKISLIEYMSKKSNFKSCDWTLEELKIIKSYFNSDGIDDIVELGKSYIDFFMADMDGSNLQCEIKKLEDNWYLISIDKYGSFESTCYLCDELIEVENFLKKIYLF